MFAAHCAAARAIRIRIFGVFGILSEQPIAVVTGATGGLGRWIALGLARADYRVILIGRDRARAEAALAWIAAQVPQASMELLIADLSLLASTRNVGERIASKYRKIAILINNAGIFEAKRTVTSEGHERVVATNHLCPFVLTEMLLPALQAHGPSRIINIGSSTSDRASIDPAQLELGAGWSMRRAYAQSKLAMMIATFAFARRLEETSVTANVVHPGLVGSGLVRSGGIIGLVWRCMALIALSEEQGADNALHAALAPELAKVSGVYFKNRRRARPNPRALDPSLVERVWVATKALTVRKIAGTRV